MKARTNQNWTITEAAHLLNRAAFGGPPDQVRAIHALGPQAAVDQLLALGTAAPSPDPLPAPAWATAEAYREQTREFLEERRAMGLEMGRPGKKKSEMTDLPPEEARKRAEARQKMQKEMRQLALAQGVELTRWWFKRMVDGPQPAREKMVLFWHGHFATSMEKVRNAYFLYLQNDLFRRFAFGDFAELTKRVTRDPAMMLYLDVQDSKRTMPNENFARELMELFTLGEGNYSEDDIKASARAFTGLRLSRFTGDVSFAKSQHDSGTKSFLGRTGNLGPDDIVDTIMAQSGCATFIARKLWRFYVNDAPTDDDVAELAGTLRAEKYQIGPVLRQLFLSEAFYRNDNIRAEIKSPVVFLAGLARHLGLKDLPGMVLLSGMREMGQQLFVPPNVAGWPGGSAWINTNTLFARYNIAGMITRSADPGYAITGLKGANRPGAKPNGPDRKSGKFLQDRIRRDWPKPDYAVIAPAKLREDPAQLVDHLVFRFFQAPLRKEDREGFLEFLRKESTDGITDTEIGKLVHLMLSTPYYQLT